MRLSSLIPGGVKETRCYKSAQSLYHRLHRKWFGELRSSDYLRQAYSQDGEDLILNRLFENQANGLYVDIGAHHPFRYSNTYLLYLKGWHGINVDPLPGSKRLFDKYRPRDINIECAIAEVAGAMTYYQFNEPVLNTVCPDLAQERDGWLGRYRLTSSIQVATTPLSKVLESHVPDKCVIDLLSIDAEGFDETILKSNDWSRFRPTLVLVEIYQASFNQVMSSKIAALLSSQGYEPIAKTVNTVFFSDCSAKATSPK